MALGAGFRRNADSWKPFSKASSLISLISRLPSFRVARRTIAVLARVLTVRKKKLLQIVLFGKRFLQILIEHALRGNAVTDDIGKNQLLRICSSKILSQARILAGGSREKHSFSIFEVLFYLAVGEAYPALHIFGSAEGRRAPSIEVIRRCSISNSSLRATP